MRVYNTLHRYAHRRRLHCPPQPECGYAEVNRIWRRLRHITRKYWRVRIANGRWPD